MMFIRMSELGLLDYGKTQNHSNYSLTQKAKDTHVPVYGGEKGVPLNLLYTIRTGACRTQTNINMMISTVNDPTLSPGRIYYAERMTCHVPNRFAGFLLKSILKRLCASRLKNCGIPNLALI